METRRFELVMITVLFWVERSCANKLDTDELQTNTLSDFVSETQHDLNCDVWGQTGCGERECCIKQVLTFSDVDRDTVLKTRCSPLLSVGDFCLPNAEGYLCDCAPGLICQSEHGESYGHCMPDFEDEDGDDGEDGE